MHVGNTTFVPLLLEHPVENELPYTSLDQALSKGSTKVTEIGRRAEVNRIHVSHHGKSLERDAVIFVVPQLTRTM